MEIEIIKGNLLDLPKDITVIAHACNVRNVIGAGIARQIKKRYPAMFLVDKNYYIKTGPGRLGKCSMYYHQLTYPKQFIGFNLYTQDLGGSDPIKTQYNALEDSLHAMFAGLNRMRKVLSEDLQAFDPILSNPVFGFPYLMGCGLGGGNWDVVDSIIKKQVANTPWKAYYVNFNF